MIDFPCYRVLIVDDEEYMRKYLVALLSKFGQICETARSGLEALHNLEKNSFDAVITDIEMPRINGIVLTQALLRTNPNLPIMVMTGFTRNYKVGTAIAAGARDFIKKPFSISEFILRFKVMMRNHDVQSRLAKKRERTHLESGGPSRKKIEQFRMQMETL